MTRDLDIPRLSDTAHDHTLATGSVSAPHDETAQREREGLPPETVVLIPALHPPPMRCPANQWALLVCAVNIISDADPVHAGQTALFAGRWVAERPSAEGLHDGDLVVRLTHPAASTYPLAREHGADVEMLLAYQGRWQRVGQWFGVDEGWPRIVAPTAAAVMDLHRDITTVLTWREPARQENTTLPRGKRAFGDITALFATGLLSAGDEFVWDRPRLGLRHSVHIGSDGSLVLSDGRAFANPTGAANALGGYTTNGWDAFRRVSDGRTLADLRIELRGRSDS